MIESEATGHFLSTFFWDTSRVMEFANGSSGEAETGSTSSAGGAGSI